MAIVEGDIESLILVQAEQQASVIWLRFFRREIDSDQKAALLGLLISELEKQAKEIIDGFYQQLPRIRDQAQKQVKDERQAARNDD